MVKCVSKLLAATSVGTCLLWSAIAGAADHRDSPSVIADPSADLADVFAWTNADADKLNLIMTTPAAAFSDAVQYVFHVESSTAYGEAGTAATVICEFAVSQAVSCWIGTGDFVQGDASSPLGLASDSGQTLAFVGPRNDPFFFNGGGFANTIAAVVAAAPSLTFDEAGCPALDAGTSNALVTMLATGNDSFANSTVQALVLQTDKALLNAGGDILAVYGSTRRR